MKTLCTTAVLLLASIFQVAHAAEPVPTVRMYIEPQEGFDSYIAAALVKKSVPIVITKNKGEAEYKLTSAVTSLKESTGGKIARCVFLYCIGIDGTQTATVELLNAKDEVAWAYNVRKAGSHNFQSSAEAIAKHLKRYFDEQAGNTRHAQWAKKK